jgi:hypothetical protein
MAKKTYTTLEKSLVVAVAIMALAIVWLVAMKRDDDPMPAKMTATSVTTNVLKQSIEKEVPGFKITLTSVKPDTTNALTNLKFTIQNTSGSTQTGRVLSAAYNPNLLGGFDSYDVQQAKVTLENGGRADVEVSFDGTAASDVMMASYLPEGGQKIDILLPD